MNKAYFLIITLIISLSISSATAATATKNYCEDINCYECKLVGTTKSCETCVRSMQVAVDGQPNVFKCGPKDTTSNCQIFHDSGDSDTGCLMCDVNYINTTPENGTNYTC